MHQVTLAEPGRFVLDDAPEPTAAPGEALVRIRRIGDCGTDLHAFAGRQPFFTYPRILGHELGVEVLAVPPNDRGIQPGDRCCIEPYLNCGVCRPCTKGKPNCCESLQVLGVHTDGGMREIIAVPVERLYKSEKLTLEQLALVETLGIGQHAVVRAAFDPGEHVLVVGAGPIGLAVLQFATAAGGNVTVLEKNPNRLKLAERFGAKAVPDVGAELFDTVFDATGSQAAMQASFSYVAFGGTLVLVGLVLNTITFDDPLFHRREMTIRASRNSAGAFPDIIRRIEAGQIDTTPWVTHRLGLTDVPTVFGGLPADPGLVKAMIEV